MGRRRMFSLLIETRQPETPVNHHPVNSIINAITMNISLNDAEPTIIPYSQALYRLHSMSLTLDRFLRQLPSLLDTDWTDSVIQSDSNGSRTLMISMRSILPLWDRSIVTVTRGFHCYVNDATHRTAIPPECCWQLRTCGKYNTVLIACGTPAACRWLPQALALPAFLRRCCRIKNACGALRSNPYVMI